MAEKSKNKNSQVPEDAKTDEEQVKDEEFRSDEEQKLKEEQPRNEEQKESVEKEDVEGAVKEKKERKPRKDKKTQQIDELKDRLVRSMAEFDNFRKRSEKEKSQMFEIGAKSILEKMLPVIDNFERGLGTVLEEEKENAFVQGMEKTYKQLMTTMEELGVQPIEAVGKEFDPNIHNAVMHAEDENLGANVVAEELQKGYMYRDMVIRYSMVKVVN